MIPTLFDPTKLLLPGDVKELIDFGIPGDARYDGMATMQAEGVAALYNMLATKGVAYLADEVGMGKTYQGLGVAAVIWCLRPAARILFVSPRQALQHKWVDEYQRFFRSNYRRNSGGDDRAKTVVLRTPTREPRKLENLREWLLSLSTTHSLAPFVRHTSFARPVYDVDEEDLAKSWQSTRERFSGLGLHHLPSEAPEPGSSASRAFNVAFAKAGNRLLEELGQGKPFYDLVLVDEAQCLRHPENQTNTVLQTLLRGQARTWLFLSATPVHGSAADVVKVLNTYSDTPHLDPQLAHDPIGLQAALQTLMVRRQRRYRISETVEFAKPDYRLHEREAWASAGRRPLEVLAMGAVQRGLVDLLSGQNNRYRIGFLSSFESLQDSIGNEDEWYRDRGERRSDQHPPDSRFVARLAGDFQRKFGVSLPHPKLDLVVDEIAPGAFGTDEEAGGEKHLIFARRVSTVHELRRRFEDRHTAAVEGRIRRCWGEKLDWTGGDVGPEEDDDEDEAEDEAVDEVSGTRSPFRLAAAKNGWLWKYRKTLQRSGRNALFLEENWLLRLCRAGGVAPKAATKALSDSLWSESYAHAARVSGGRASIDRPRRMRYLALHGVRREPGAFGLSGDKASAWANALSVILHTQLEESPSGEVPRRQPVLFEETLWTAWDSSSVLPALPGGDANPDEEALYRRSVVRSLLAQSLRLTDTLLDLFYADRQAERVGKPLVATFVGWAEGDDPSASAFRARAAEWIVHDRLIADSCLGGAGKAWRELARTESWPQLYNPVPVAGVTGGARGSRQAVRQFRLPSWPTVMVCTDTLKEGVDLHLFCDTVVHYGIAWTSGDMEQRVGRVDRYFSQIERRLRKGSGSPKLRVFYPHVKNSLEEGQIDRVIARQREAEALMDSPLGAILGDDAREIDLNAGPRRLVTSPGPFERPTFPAKGNRIVAITQTESSARRHHFERWQAGFLSSLGLKADRALDPVREVIIAGRVYTFRWGFDAPLGRYTITIDPDPLPRPEQTSGARVRRLVGKSMENSTLLRVLVPRPLEADCTDRVRQVFEGWQPEASQKETRTVVLGPRAHRIRVYRYDGLLRAVSPFLSLSDVCERGRQEVERRAHEATAELSLGYLDVHDRDGLFLGVRLIHAVEDDAVNDIVREIARRADQYEELWTGKDVF